MTRERLFIQDDFLFIIENPDMIYVSDGHGGGKNLFNWGTGGDAYAFGYYKGKMIISQEGGKHSDTIGNDRRNMKFPGRIWTRKKVISFWNYPSTTMLKKIIKDINNTFNKTPLDNQGSDDFPDYDKMYPDTTERSYYPKTPVSRGDDYGKIKIDGKWRLDVPAKSGENYDKFVTGTGGAEVKAGDYMSNGYLYSLKTIFSNKPLKGVGEKLRKGEKVDTDTGKGHVAPAMLKKGKIAKMSKRAKKELYNYFKDKGRLSKEEERMYKMIRKEDVDIYFDGEKFIFENKIRDELNTHDSHEVEMGKKVEKEHDNDDDVDIITSEEDLMKVVLAHLREDPKYYTKLKKVEESNIKHFTLEEGTGILTEAPHIAVGEKVIDLEFEKNKIEAMKKIIKAIMREEITDKYGSKFKLSSDSEVNEFIKKIMKNPQIRRMLK